MSHEDPATIVSNLDEREPPRSAAYTFGDLPVEAERLGVLNDVFGPASRALLSSAALRPPGLAYDLGCGPGHTTRMVAETTGARATVGLERSLSHVTRAAATATERIRFVVWDVTEVPFPAGSADLICARLLPAHLLDPVRTALAWATQLNEGGLLVVDEIEWIATEHPVLRAHLDLAVARVATTGAQMCAGPSLVGLGEHPGLDQRLGQVAELSVPTASAATMFAMSLTSWGEQAVADGLCTKRQLRELSVVVNSYAAPPPPDRSPGDSTKRPTPVSSTRPEPSGPPLGSRAAGLGYLFWHAPSDPDSGDYEAVLVAWQQALAAHPPPGFVRGWTWRLPAPPWLVGWPENVYLDVYIVADFAALGALNSHAPAGILQGAHDAAASRAERGSGGLFACQSGTAEPQPAATASRAVQVRWYDKPIGITYPQILGSLAGEERSVWLRQMVLGPGPELLVVGSSPDGSVSPAGVWTASAQMVGPMGRN